MLRLGHTRARGDTVDAKNTRSGGRRCGVPAASCFGQRPAHVNTRYGRDDGDVLPRTRRARKTKYCCCCYRRYYLLLNPHVDDKRQRHIFLTRSRSARNTRGGDRTRHQFLVGGGGGELSTCRWPRRQHRCWTVSRRFRRTIVSPVRLSSYGFSAIPFIDRRRFAFSRR